VTSGLPGGDDGPVDVVGGIDGGRFGQVEGAAGLADEAQSIWDMAAATGR